MPQILVADDDMAIRETVKELLDIAGYGVDTACDGSEAVRAIKKTSYDLVILDRSMPILSGIDVLRILRSGPQFKGLKILMLTSASVTKEVDEAFAAGADGYILKPLDMTRFLDTVQKTLNR